MILIRYHLSWLGPFVVAVAATVIAAVWVAIVRAGPAFVMLPPVTRVGVVVIRYFMVRDQFPRFLARAVGLDVGQRPITHIGDSFPEY